MQSTSICFHEIDHRVKRIWPANGLSVTLANEHQNSEITMYFTDPHLFYAYKQLPKHSEFSLVIHDTNERYPLNITDPTEAAEWLANWYQSEVI